MFAMTTSASVSVPTSIPSATVPSPTSRSWRKLCWGCLKPGLPLIKTLRPLVRRKNSPLKVQEVQNYCRCRACAGRAAAAAVAIAYLSQMYFLLQTVRQHNLVHSLEKASCCFARRPVYLLLKI